jgi:2-polyprenyl-3-methyl-5-hydroxy-6-metoxy-1,4-benzoquinol methylase
MSLDLWKDIEAKLDSHAYMEGIDRSIQRVKETAEIFTPNSLVLEILMYLDLDLFAPGKTVLDPACGDGQFLIAAKWIKVFHHRMKEEEALLDIYGVDIMRDNVDVCRKRLGGGTVIVGDSLNPTRRINGQTDSEHELMKSLFVVQTLKTSRLVKKRNKEYLGQNDLMLDI